MSKLALVEFKMLRLTLLFALIVATSACGKFNGAGESADIFGNGKIVVPYGTCDRSAVATINLCMEAVGSDYNEAGYLDILKSSCESTGGIYSVKNCDRTTSWGTCYVDPNIVNETHVTYYAPQYTAQSAMEACQQTPGGFYLKH